MLTYQDIFTLRMQEKTESTLQPLPKDFFIDVKDLFKTLSGNQLENCKKLFKEIMEIRRAKILKYIILNKVPENLTEKEKELFSKITQINSEYDKFIAEFFDNKKRKVRFVKSLPKIVIGSYEVGPYSENEEAEVENEVAEMLNKKGICEFV